MTRTSLGNYTIKSTKEDTMISDKPSSPELVTTREYAVICMIGLVVFLGFLAYMSSTYRSNEVTENALLDISLEQVGVAKMCDKGYASSLEMLEKFTFQPTGSLTGTSKHQFTLVPEVPTNSNYCKGVVSSYFIRATPRPGTKEGLKHYGLNPSGLYSSPQPIPVTFSGAPPKTTKVEHASYGG